MLKNLIYIYQLEHYDVRRFLKFAYKNLNWFRLSQRGKLDWTLRAKLIFTISICAIIIAVAKGAFYSVPYSVGVAIASIILLPFVIVASDKVISPLVSYKKKEIVDEARNILKGNKNLTVVGITGSFGKTSMKHILASVISESKKVLFTTGNINTSIGVSKFIIDNKIKLAEADVFIVEMGAYKRGNIKSVAEIVNPDYSIITGIGEVHLDRFGSLQNIISTKFELANLTKKTVFLNTCNKIVKDNAGSQITTGVKTKNICSDETVSEVTYKDNFEGIRFTYEGETFETKLIAGHTISLIVLAIEVAKELGLGVLDLKKGVAKIDYISHRQEVMRNQNTGVTVIDDSYNGNLSGFLSGLEVLQRSNGRRVVMTPGIVELGVRSKEVHEELAKKYTETTDLVLLIDNENTKYIKDAFDRAGFNKYRLYKTASEAHADLAKVLEFKDTIIFQNDITDNYK